MSNIRGLKPAVKLSPRLPAWCFLLPHCYFICGKDCHAGYRLAVGVVEVAESGEFEIAGIGRRNLFRRFNAGNRSGEVGTDLGHAAMAVAAEHAAVEHGTAKALGVHRCQGQSAGWDGDALFGWVHRGDL